MKNFVAGNWKMHKSVSESLELARELRGLVSMVRDRCDVAVAPAFTSLYAIAKALDGSNIGVAGQHCHAEVSGPFTGEVSASMLKDAGAHYVILGHSERRRLFGETDVGVNRKLAAALKALLMPIVCVGETLLERESNRTLTVVETQLKGALSGFAQTDLVSLVVAYEPVWAIGTGKTATARQAQEVHAHLRALLIQTLGAACGAQIRIQYGGSVKPENAAELFSQTDINGALVGGASLQASDFSAIVKAGA
jgi:triosephosphate isomerase (TIM)